MYRQQEFENELTKLINIHSLEGEFGNTPDFILSKYVMKCLQNYKEITDDVNSWQGN